LVNPSAHFAHFCFGKLYLKTPKKCKKCDFGQKKWANGHFWKTKVGRKNCEKWAKIGQNRPFLAVFGLKLRYF